MDTQLRVDVAVGAKSEVSSVLARDVATVRQLEQAVLQLRRLTESGGARGGTVLPGLPAVARVAQAQDTLGAAQRQAAQAARAAAPIPPAPPPRVSPSRPALVPRPDLGPGVFGAPASAPRVPGGNLAAVAAAAAATGVRPPSQQPAAAAQPPGREPAWVAEQRRLAALAASQRGATTQGPQAVRGMADETERLARVLRDGAVIARTAAGAEEQRGRAVGGSAAQVAAAAALGAGVAAGVGGAGRGAPRTELREAARAAARGLEGQLALPQFGGKQSIALPRTIDPARLAASLDAQEIQARTAAAVAQRQAAFLRTPEGKGAAQDVLYGQALQRQREAELRLTAARIPKGRRVAAAEGTAYRDELAAGRREQLEQTRAQLREAGIRSRRAETKSGAAELARQAGAEYQLAGADARERAAAALAVRPGIGGDKSLAAALGGARAGALEGVNAAAMGAVGAQAQTAYAGTAEGRKALADTARLRREEARALNQLGFRQRVAEIGTFGASLEKASDKAKMLGDYARNAFAFRVAEAGLLVGAASPSAIATLADSATLLAAKMGKSLIPAVDAVSLKLQQLAGGYGNLSPGAQQGISTTFLASTAGLAGLWGLARVIQGAKWAWAGESGAGGIRGAATWLTGGGAQAAAARAATAAFPANMGPGTAAAAVGGGAGVPGAFMGITAAGLGTAAALTAVGAAALAAEYGILEWSSQQRKAAYARNEAIAADLSRKDVVESEAYKRAAAAGTAEEQKAVAGKEYDEAARQFAAASKKAAQEGGYSFRNFFEDIEQSVGGRRADHARAEMERDAARKRIEIAKAAYDEIVNKNKFQGGPGSADARKADELHRTIVGLPQTALLSLEAYGERLSVAALNPEGELRNDIMQQQLDNLKEIGGLLTEIKILQERVPQPTRRR